MSNPKRMEEVAWRTHMDHIDCTINWINDPGMQLEVLFIGARWDIPRGTILQEKSSLLARRV